MQRHLRRNSSTQHPATSIHLHLRSVRRYQKARRPPKKPIPHHHQRRTQKNDRRKPKTWWMRLHASAILIVDNSCCHMDVWQNQTTQWIVANSSEEKMHWHIRKPFAYETCVHMFLRIRIFNMNTDDACWCVQIALAQSKSSNNRQRLCCHGNA